MEIKPIRNEADYDAALTAIDGLMGAPANTTEGDHCCPTNLGVWRVEVERFLSPAVLVGAVTIAVPLTSWYGELKLSVFWSRRFSLGL